MNFEEEMKKVLKDGELTIGEKTVKKGLLNGSVKMAIVATHASQDMKEELKRYAELSNIKYYEYPESSRELGYACAKPFPVSCLAIIKEGSSKILQLE